MTLIIFAHIAGLLIGFCAGAWAATAVKVFKRQPDPFEVPHGWERET